MWGGIRVRFSWGSVLVLGGGCVGCGGWKIHRRVEISVAPTGLDCVCGVLTAWLTPWATFCRRYAAGVWCWGAGREMGLMRGRSGAALWSLALRAPVRQAQGRSAP